MQAFDALVAAYEPGPGPGGLRALVPLAGRPLVEHQLRRAVAAGAERLWLLVDEVPVELAEVVAALRRDGVAVDPVAGLDVAADRLSPDRLCLVVADACLPDEDALHRLVAPAIPALATLPDEAANERHERIDAATRWAGAVLLDGARVADAAAMLGSWDPVSTLLRRAVQEGLPRIDLGDRPPALLLHPSEMAAADARVVAAARAAPRDWTDRWIAAPLLAAVVPRLVARGTPPAALGWLAAGASLLAGLLALAGWRWPPLLLLLLAPPVAASARQLARVADRPLPGARASVLVAGLGAALAALGLGLGLARGTTQWGWLLVGVLVVALLALVERMRTLLPAPLWLAGVGPLPWALLPFALAGRWDAGSIALALYAAASFLWLFRALLPVAASSAAEPARPVVADGPAPA